jgi:hypothetical protein
MRGSDRAFEDSLVRDVDLREVFRACYQHYLNCGVEHSGGAELERCNDGRGHISYSRRAEDFRCDFECIAKRALTLRQHVIFKRHFLGSESGTEVAKRLSITTAAFAYEVEEIEQRLGRAYRDTKPYALHPLWKYFGARAIRAVAKRTT